MNPVHEHCSSQNVSNFFFIKKKSNKISQNFRKIKISKKKKIEIFEIFFC